jgi:hypothetical protein
VAKIVDVYIQSQDSIYDNGLNYSNDDINLNKELYNYLEKISQEYDEEFIVNFVLKEKISCDSSLLKENINAYYKELYEEKLLEKKDSIKNIVKYMFFGFLILYFYISLDNMENIAQKVLSEGFVILAWLFVWEGFDKIFDLSSYKSDLLIYQRLSNINITVTENF